MGDIKSRIAEAERKVEKVTSILGKAIVLLDELREELATGFVGQAPVSYEEMADMIAEMAEVGQFTQKSFKPGALHDVFLKEESREVKRAFLAKFGPDSLRSSSMMGKALKVLDKNLMAVDYHTTISKFQTEWNIRSYPYTEEMKKKYRQM